MALMAFLSPAKSLRFGAPLGSEAAMPVSEPRFLPKSGKLARAMRKLDAAAIGALMEVSPALSELNWRRFRDVDKPLAEDDPACRRAVFCFDGDAYEGLRPETLPADALARLGSRARILSGYYGLLRPFDLMRAYRLEMGRKPAGVGAASLYDFWGGSIALALALDARQSGATEAICLASQEYALAATKWWDASLPLHSTRFETQTPKGRKVVSFDAKRARGLFARHIALSDPASAREAAESFALEGWSLDKAGGAGAGSPRSWTFVKKMP